MLFNLLKQNFIIEALRLRGDASYCNGCLRHDFIDFKFRPKCLVCINPLQKDMNPLMALLDVLVPL